jgi:hypothetical protein
VIILRPKLVIEILRRDPVGQNVMRGLQVEGLLDLGVGGEVEGIENENGEDQPFCNRVSCASPITIIFNPEYTPNPLAIITSLLLELKG